MTIPTKDQIRLPLLKFLKNGQVKTLQETIEKMTSEFPKLTEDDKNQRTAVAQRKVFDTRVSWSVSELRHANLLESVKIGFFKITSQGKSLLINPPSQITHKFLLEHYPSYKKWIKESQDRKKIQTNITKQDSEDKEGIVLFMDILGIKEIWKDEKNKNNVFDRWNEINVVIRKMLNKEFKNKTNISTISDTIIVTIRCNITDLKKLAPALWSVITFSIDKDLPIRGCFSYGKYFQKDAFLFGKAVNEAYYYYELPQWIGISACPSANQKLIELSENDKEIERYFSKCSIPLKQSYEQDAIAINWPRFLDEDVPENKDALEKILKIINKHLSSFYVPDISLKWRNTRKFALDYIQSLIAGSSSNIDGSSSNIDGSSSNIDGSSSNIAGSSSNIDGS